LEHLPRARTDTAARHTKSAVTLERAAARSFSPEAAARSPEEDHLPADNQEGSFH